MPRAASGETWEIKEGFCLDWIGSWTMTKISDKNWRGPIKQKRNWWAVRPSV